MLKERDAEGTESRPWPFWTNLWLYPGSWAWGRWWSACCGGRYSRR